MSLSDPMHECGFRLTGNCSPPDSWVRLALPREAILTRGAGANSSSRNLARDLIRKACSDKSATFEDDALRHARKLDRDAGGENALELHPSLFDRNDTVSFII